MDYHFRHNGEVSTVRDKKDDAKYSRIDKLLPNPSGSYRIHLPSIHLTGDERCTVENAGIRNAKTLRGNPPH